MQQVMLAVRLAALADELDGTQYKIVNRILDPRGDLIDESEIGFAISGEAARPEWLVGVPIPLLVQFEVAEEGTYTVELSVDDASACRAWGAGRTGRELERLDREHAVQRARGGALFSGPSAKDSG